MVRSGQGLATERLASAERMRPGVTADAAPDANKKRRGGMATRADKDSFRLAAYGCLPKGITKASRKALGAVIFGYFSVECPLNKFDGINCCPKLNAKLCNGVLSSVPVSLPPVD